ncbi:hypothetical protein F5887DRAFT_1080689 [Amanita rubescens]|nr:hypothetical protein F5887DRAFT_1080689 [Amanita rubescens]
MDYQHGSAGHSHFFSPPDYDQPSATPLKTHDGAGTTFTPSQTFQGQPYSSPGPHMLMDNPQMPVTPRPRPIFNQPGRSNEDNILSVTRYPHPSINYGMAPTPPPFHNPPSTLGQPGTDHPSIHARHPHIRSQLATADSITSTVNQSNTMQSDDEPFGMSFRDVESKPKKSKQATVTKADGKNRKTEAKAALSSTKAKSNQKAQSHGGRAHGSRNFQTAETTMLLSLIQEHLPIGGRSWEVIAAIYNKWAAKEQFKERDKKSLKQKFDALITAANKKPTGDGERDELLVKALELEEAIGNRAVTVTLDDAELDSSSGESEALNAGQDAVVISDSEEGGPKDVQAKVRAGKKGPTAKVVTTKNYRISDPLSTDNTKKPPRGMALATGALEKITGFFDPENVREREESRMSQTIGLAQLSAAQTEIATLRARIDTLTDRLTEESRRAEAANRRADKAENKLEMLQLQSRSYSRSHSHSRSDVEPTGTRAGPSKRHEKRRSHHRRRRSHSSPVSSPSQRPSQRQRVTGPDDQINQGPSLIPASETDGLNTLARLASEQAEQPQSYMFTVSPRKRHDGKLAFEFVHTKE